MDKKEQIAVQLPKATLDKIAGLQKLDKSISSRNICIEKAVDFYFSYITTEISQDYLLSIVGQKVEGLINKSTNRIAKLDFKEAVELNVLTRILASQFDIDKMSYDKLRKKAVDDVKATQGIINVYDAK